MAKIVTSGRPVVGNVTHPLSAHSRVVGCNAALGPSPFSTYSFTPTLGQNLWLLNVSVWGFLTPGGAVRSIEFDIHTMTTRPTSGAQVFAADHVVPCHTPTGLSGWIGMADSFSFSWDMARLYVGEGRRFAF